jgi:energy-coupling factor transporter ATP-binding protein EcfA2
MRIEEISFSDLKPFKVGTVKFPLSQNKGKLGEVHLFTGPNGTGKSRLLSVLAAATNSGDLGGSKRFPAGLSRKVTGHVNGKAALAVASGTNILAKTLPHLTTNLAFAFSGVPHLEPSKLDVLKGTPIPSPQERLAFQPWGSVNSNQRIANLKVQAAMDLMNGEPTTPGRSLKVARRLENTITELTGRRFSVIAQAHPQPGLKFQWGDEILPIEGLPEGLNCLLSWMFAAATVLEISDADGSDPLMNEAIFFLDEPETHLHPEWQRKILPMAQRLFPNSQFFVATHSPFIVSSLNDGYIYKLQPDEHGSVTVSPAEPAGKGDSYATALSEILGVDEWFDPESETLMAKFREQRDYALKGDKAAESEAIILAESIASRSNEPANIMGMEMRQLERLLSNKTATTAP